MTTYEVQFVFPVDNPMSNVAIKRCKGRLIFYVPINHPDAHNMGLQDLIAAQELSGIIHLSTPHKNNSLDSKTFNSKVASCQPSNSTPPAPQQARPSRK